MSNTRSPLMSEVIALPPARLVRGSVVEPFTTDREGEMLDTPEWWAQLAVDKKYMDALRPKLVKFADEYYPRRGKKFNWAMLDGDEDEYAEREGWPGSWVLRVGTKRKPKWMDNKNHEIDPVKHEVMQLGDYIQALVTVWPSGAEKHGNQPGLKIYLQAVKFLRRGERIVIGPDLSQALANPDEYGDFETEDLDSEVFQAPGAHEASGDIPF